MPTIEEARDVAIRVLEEQGMRAMVGLVIAGVMDDGPYVQAALNGTPMPADPFAKYNETAIMPAGEMIQPIAAVQNLGEVENISGDRV